MTPSQNCFRVVKMFEGCRLTAYRCPAGIPTIGYGATRYPSGQPVKMGETITQQRADLMLEWHLKEFGGDVKMQLINTLVNQNQFDALVSFAYNCGIGALAKSTLMKKVRNNPNDESIRAEFAKWNKAGGKELAGLTRRRKVEADLYFKP